MSFAAASFADGPNSLMRFPPLNPALVVPCGRWPVGILPSAPHGPPQPLPPAALEGGLPWTGLPPQIGPMAAVAAQLLQRQPGGLVPGDPAALRAAASASPALMTSAVLGLGAGGAHHPAAAHSALALHHATQLASDPQLDKKRAKREANKRSAQLCRQRKKQAMQALHDQNQVHYIIADVVYLFTLRGRSFLLLLLLFLSSSCSCLLPHCSSLFFFFPLRS